MTDAKSYMLEWNIRFPLDHWWRKKYNIPFGSEQHKVMSQIDIYLEYVEEMLYKEYTEKGLKEIKDKEDFDKGIWLKEIANTLTKEQEDELYTKIKISSFSSIKLEDE